MKRVKSLLHSVELIGSLWRRIYYSETDVSMKDSNFQRRLLVFLSKRQTIRAASDGHLSDYRPRLRIDDVNLVVALTCNEGA